MKKFLLSIFLVAFPFVGQAFTGTVEIDGISYNLITKDNIAEVAKSTKYEGDIVVPSTVEYEGITCKVTSVESSAFASRSKLTSVVLPESITSIGSSAFSNCSKLASVQLPKGLKRIESSTFSGCKALGSVELPSELEYIAHQAFYGCESLSAITIPASVIQIGTWAFYGCKGLTVVHITDLDAWCNVEFVKNMLSDYIIFNNPWSLYLNGEEVKELKLPEGLTAVKNGIFSYGNFTSITIPLTVTTIGQHSFMGCKEVSEIVIPEGVTQIAAEAFKGCSKLTSVSLPGSLQKIGSYAFQKDTEIKAVYCYAEKVPDAGSSVFDGCNIEYSTLYVPTAAIDNYKVYTPWKNFKEIHSIAGDATDHKCQKPTITYETGKLAFASETEGAEFYYTIEDTDISQNKGSQIQLTVTYNIKVYATKAAWENSDPAYATLCWIDQTPKTEGITGITAQVHSTPVMIQNSGGTVSVSGATPGTSISVYQVTGELMGTAVAGEGTTAITTSLGKDKIAIVKIGDKAVKLLLK